MCAKRHLDPSSCLSTAHECDRQTDGHSCSKEPLYCVARLKADLAQSLICHRRFLVQSDCVRIKGSKEKRKARPSTWNWEGLRCLDSEFFASAASEQASKDGTLLTCILTRLFLAKHKSSISYRPLTLVGSSRMRAVLTGRERNVR